MKTNSKCHSQLNRSSAKQLFSFSKAQRFSHHSPSAASVHFYEIPNTNTRRAYCFSKAERIPKCPQQPGLNSNTSSFSLQGISDIKRSLKKGISFATGRNECKAENFIKVSRNPGPGAYHPNPEFTLKRIRVGGSLGRLRTKSSDPKGGKDTPGPANYNIKSSLLNDHKILSKDYKKAVGRILFNELKLSSKRKQPQVFPAFRLPDLNKKGEHMSKFQRGHRLGKASRFKTQMVDSRPGPGTYECFSEFVDQE